MAQVFFEEFKTKLQEELDEPVKWKDICNVEYTTSKVLHNPYMTEPVVQTGTRGCAYTHRFVYQTDENTVIDTFRLISDVIDRADLAQGDPYTTQMVLAKRMGVVLNENIEAAVYAARGSYTAFDNASIGGAAGSITLAATNVDDVIRGVAREIGEADGLGLYERNGGFFVWRHSDLEIVKQFAQSTGFSESDKALQKAGGQNGGFEYMGFTHYGSNQLVGGSVIAGVKKAIHLGILSTTFGDIDVNEHDPGLISGISITSRVDYKVMAWTRTKPVIFEVKLA